MEKLSLTMKPNKEKLKKEVLEELQFNPHFI